MVSIQDFDSCCIGSNPIRFTNGGGSSLWGKMLHCGWGEQGANPKVTQKGTIAKLVNAPDWKSEDTGSIPVCSTIY